MDSRKMIALCEVCTNLFNTRDYDCCPSCSYPPAKSINIEDKILVSKKKNGRNLYKVPSKFSKKVKNLS